MKKAATLAKNLDALQTSLSKGNPNDNKDEDHEDDP